MAVIKSRPTQQIRFYDRQGNYLPHDVDVQEAERARALIGTRKIRRGWPGMFTVESDDGGKYVVDLAELECECPQVAMRRVKVCKHLVACQWIEDAVRDV